MNLSVAYLLLGPAGLLEHHPGDVGSLRVGHGVGGQVALMLEARLALRLTQQSGASAAVRPRRHRALLLPTSRCARSADRARVWKPHPLNTPL